MNAIPDRRSDDGLMRRIAKECAREALDEHHRENVHFWELIGEDVGTPLGRAHIRDTWQWAADAHRGTRYMRRGFWGAIAAASAAGIWKFSGWVAGLVWAAK